MPTSPGTTPSATGLTHNPASGALSSGGREELCPTAPDVRKDELRNALTGSANPSEAASFAVYIEMLSRAPEGEDLITSRAISSFAAAPTAEAAEGSFEADEANIRQWLSRLVAAGHTPLTVRRYLGKIRTLYAAYRPACTEAEALFAALREALQAPGIYKPFEAKEALPFIRQFPARLERMDAAEALPVRLLLYMLYSGIPFSEAINSRYGVDPEAMDLTDQAADLAADMHRARPRALYVFPLGQGKNRPARIVADAAASIGAALRVAGCYLKAPVTPDTICGWWVQTALDCGIPPAHILATLSGNAPATHPWLKLIKPSALTESGKRGVRQAVANAICPLTPQWYALSLRGRTEAGDVERELAEKHPGLARSVTLFYPTTTEVTRIGKKKVRRQVPCIRHILFVKTKAEKIVPLMHAIGHLAWCYKTTNRPDAPYSVISRRHMAEFQRFIGIFADGENSGVTQVANNAPVLQPGMRVRITGGLFAGHEGLVEREVSTAPHTVRTYVLRLSHTYALRCEATLAAPLLTPLDHV